LMDQAFTKFGLIQLSIQHPNDLSISCFKTKSQRACQYRILVEFCNQITWVEK